MGGSRVRSLTNVVVLSVKQNRKLEKISSDGHAHVIVRST